MIYIAAAKNLKGPCHVSGESDVMWRDVASVCRWRNEIRMSQYVGNYVWQCIYCVQYIYTIAALSNHLRTYVHTLIRTIHTSTVGIMIVCTVTVRIPCFFSFSSSSFFSSLLRWFEDRHVYCTYDVVCSNVRNTRQESCVMYIPIALEVVWYVVCVCVCGSLIGCAARLCEKGW